MKTKKAKTKLNRKKFRFRFNFRDMKLYLFIREIINYRFILSTIKKQKVSEQWNALKLRADKLGRIYTVINIRKEDVGESDMVKRSRVFEYILPINNYMRKLDLHEIVFPAIEQVTPQSYLIVYSPMFKTITVLRTLKYLIYVSLFIYIAMHIGPITSYVLNIF